MRLLEQPLSDNYGIWIPIKIQLESVEEFNGFKEEIDRMIGNVRYNNLLSSENKSFYKKDYTIDGIRFFGAYIQELDEKDQTMVLRFKDCDYKDKIDYKRSRSLYDAGFTI